MKFSRLDPFKRLNCVSLVQGCWVILAILISIGQTKANAADPTKPPEAVIALTPQSADNVALDWQLQAVKAEGKNSMVIVNGRWVAYGKEYEGYRLVHVTPSKALFVDKSGNKKELSLGVKTYQTLPKTNKKLTRVKVSKSHNKS